jgi:hypothetical protein
MPDMAQVLNTLAHEIRTPLAVSQGYLKLYVDGRLKTPDDQQRALQQTREALGVIATLCSDMSKVSALSEAPEPALTEPIDAQALLTALRDSSELAGANWKTDAAPSGRIASNGPRDLTRALAVMLKAAFDDARDEPHAIEAGGDGTSLLLWAGSATAVAPVKAGPDAPPSRPVDVGRGGKGLTLIWASFILQQHRVRAWHHQDHRASIGIRIPLGPL